MQPTIKLTPTATADAVATLEPGIYSADVEGYVVTLLNGAELAIDPADGIRGRFPVTVHVKANKRVVVRFR